MNDKLITFEDGVITLGGEEVPGILASLTVDGSVRFDEKKVDGASGKKRTPQGFDDCNISVTLYLTTDDDSVEDAKSCYDKLEILTGMFRKVDGKANPQIFTVANRHMSIRGIRQVVFSRLHTAEKEGSDEIIAQLGFTEYNPPIVKTEKAAAKTPTSSELAEKAKEKTQGEEVKPEEEKIIIDLD